MSRNRWCRGQAEYAWRAYRSLPVTFLRRVVCGRDPYWKRFFWSRWGIVPADVRASLAGGPVLWIDALSGGEVTQLVTFCRLLREALPTHRLLLSTSNRYAFEFATASLAVDAVMETPWDLQPPAQRALRAVAPRAMIAVENFTAPVLFHEAHRRGIPTLLVSGLMSKQIHKHPMLWRTMDQLHAFLSLDAIGAKSQEDVQGFLALGVGPDRVTVTGNMKFDLDALSVSKEEQLRLKRQLHLHPERPVLLAASLHPGEERFVGEAYRRIRQAIPTLQLLLVPRYTTDVGMVEQALQRLGLATVRKTALREDGVPSGTVIIVDTFGELARLYAIATVVFLGGSTYLRHVVGLGQNLVEPLVHHCPVFFGLYMNLWTELTDELKRVWPAVEVTTPQGLADGLVELLQDPALLGRLKAKAAELTGRHRDDVRRNADLVLATLGAPRPQAEVALPA